MSTRIESVHRRLLPLTVAAYLLAAAVSQLTAGSAAAGPDAGRGQIQTAGVNVGLGFHGYWGPYRPYYRPFYRPYYGLYPYAYPYLVYHGDYVIPRYASRFARLDLNVRPKKTTQVFVDGQYVGLSGQFDGWPEYLWLEASRRPAAAGRNTYELIFYNPGYKTVVRQLDVQPGALIKVREEMQPGESIPPEELSTASRPAPSEPAPRRLAAPAPMPPPPPGERGSRPETLDTRQQPARLKLTVAPADASVYLDGHFLGVAGEIGEQRSGILVDPGDHRLEIVRPGHASRELAFTAEPGSAVELEVELVASASRTGPSA